MSRHRSARTAALLLSSVVGSLVFFPSLWLAAVEAGDSDTYLCGDWIGEFYVSYDLTGSFKHDIPIVKKLVPELFRGLATELPGSKFAVGFFADKPGNPPSGAPYDVSHGLIEGMTEDIDLISSSMQSMKGFSGADWEEGQLEAMYHGVADKESGWTTEQADVYGTQYIRFFIVATDAPYHKAGDRSSLLGYPAHTMDPAADCSKADYPSEQMVVDLFKERNLKPIFLLKSGPPGSATDVVPYYEKLNDMIGTGGIITPLSTDSTNLIEAIMTSVHNITCSIATTGSPTTSISSTGTGVAVPPPGPNIPLIAGATAGVVGVVAAAGGVAYALSPGSKLSPELEFEHSVDEMDVDKEQMTEVKADQFTE